MTNKAGVKVQMIRKGAQTQETTQNTKQNSANGQVKGKGFLFLNPIGSSIVSAIRLSFSILPAHSFRRIASMLKRNPPARHIERPMTLHIFGKFVGSSVISWKPVMRW